MARDIGSLEPIRNSRYSSNLYNGEILYLGHKGRDTSIGRFLRESDEVPGTPELLEIPLESVRVLKSRRIIFNSAPTPRVLSEQECEGLRRLLEQK